MVAAAAAPMFGVADAGKGLGEVLVMAHKVVAPRKQCCHLIVVLGDSARKSCTPVGIPTRADLACLFQARQSVLRNVATVFRSKAGLGRWACLRPPNSDTHVLSPARSRPKAGVARLFVRFQVWRRGLRLPID